MQDQHQHQIKISLLIFQHTECEAHCQPCVDMQMRCCMHTRHRPFAAYIVGQYRKWLGLCAIPANQFFFQLYMYMSHAQCSPYSLGNCRHNKHPFMKRGAYRQDQLEQIAKKLEGPLVVQKGAKDGISDGKQTIYCEGNGSKRRAGGQVCPSTSPRFCCLVMVCI